MYTIKEAAARTGLTVPVLRAWERRYGVVAPMRTAGGYRVYDEAALQRLRSMRRLVDDGWSPSAAAAAIIAGTNPPAGIQTDSTAEEKEDRLVEQFVDAAATLDSPRIEAVLDEMFARGTYERVMEDHVIPSLRALGDAWAAGRVPVAGEHVASNAALRRLAASFQATGPGRDQGRPVLVGMPPGARHELGALMFATALRRAGLSVVYLGADLPLDDWIAAVERTDARAVVIGAVMPADATGAMSVAERLLARRPEILIAFGGTAAPDPDAATASASTIRLPVQMGEAVAALSASLPDDRASPPGRSTSRRFPA
jgi:DNA-binding transcriptional MerR regulator/methylmalonyl-CoA mutase cobalamin-binding subunit